MVGGGLEKTIANMHISLAIPSPMDVKHSVIFEMDSSKVLLDCSKDFIISFFIMRSLAVFISSYSLCAWEIVFSMCLLLLSTNLGMLESVTPSLQFFWPGGGIEVSANWLPLEELGHSRVDVSKMCNNWIIWGSQIREC